MSITPSKTCTYFALLHVAHSPSTLTPLPVTQPLTSQEVDPLASSPEKTRLSCISFFSHLCLVSVHVYCCVIFKTGGREGGREGGEGFKYGLIGGAEGGKER